MYAIRMRWNPTPFEIAVALARLEYGVPLTAFNVRVLERAAELLRESEELILDDTLPLAV